MGGADIRDDGYARPGNVGGGQYGPGMANFAVRLVHGPNWDPGRPIREQDGWDEHAAFMDGLVKDGFIILGGPVGDGHDRRTGRARCVRAAREQGVHPGYPLGRDYPGLDDVLLVALTERRTPDEIDRLAEVLAA